VPTAPGAEVSVLAKMQASRERRFLFYATIDIGGASEIGENRNFIIVLKC
jgi:hypothetical protein